MSLNDTWVLLVQSDDCEIMFCKKSNRFSVNYKSCFAMFKPMELEHLHIVISTLRISDFYADCMGLKKVKIKNPHAKTGFILSQEDARLLGGLLGKSLTLYDSFSFGSRSL